MQIFLVLLLVLLAYLVGYHLFSPVMFWIIKVVNSKGNVVISLFIFLLFGVFLNAIIFFGILKFGLFYLS